MKHTEHKTAFTVRLLAAAIALASLNAHAQDGDAEELGTLEVTAEKEGPVGPDAGYKADRSLTATKTDTPVEETPRSISITTRKTIEDRDANTLTDILNYMPGVYPSAFAVHDALAADIFYVRGMNQRNYGYGAYRDGLRMQANAYSTSAEPYGLERVELFKGPTSVLYGENVPGGLVNMVSKRPTETTQGEVNLTYGTFDRRQVSADVSGALMDSGNVLGRLVFLGRRADTQTDSVPDDRIYFAPSLTVKLTDADTLTLLAQYQKDDTEIQTGLPAAGTLLDSPYGEMDPSHSLGHPEWDTFDREFWSLGYEYEHQFNDQWDFRQNARYLRSRVKRNEVWWSYPPAGVGGAIGDGYDPFVGAYGRDRKDESRSFAIDNQLVGKVAHGQFENTYLMGVAYDKLSYDQRQYVGSAIPLSVFDPEWPAPPSAFINYANPPSSDGEIKQDLIGAYGQVQTKVGGLIGLLGLRYDYADSETINRANSAASVDTTDQELTYQAGLMYQFDNGISPYASYATSFAPVQQLQNSGEGFDPVTGDQAEIGIKYEPVGTDLLFTVAGFYLVKENDVIFDSNAGEFRQVGETRSKGAEFEMTGNVTDSLSMTAAYTYTDAELTDDAGSYAEGKQLTAIPRHMASVWANYEFMGGVMDGFRTGVGVRYLGKSYGYPDSPFGTLETEGATLVDLALGYQFNPNWSVTLSGKNVFDKEYVGECNDAGRCYWGAERTVQGTLSYNY